MTLLNSFATLVHNPIFSGVVGGGFVASIFYGLRSVPGKLFEFFRRWFTVSLTVKGMQSFYPILNNWLAKHEFSKRATRLQLTSETRAFEDDSGNKDPSLILGMGNHLIWVGRTPLFVNRSQQEKGSVTSAYITAFSDESIMLTTIGRNQATIKKIIKEAISLERHDDTITVMSYEENSFSYGIKRVKRDIASIFIPEVQKSRILHDLERFYANRNVYIERGTPWRRGYQFTGVPGTGKTSLIFALASYFNKPVRIINLANIGGDSCLMSAINEAGSDCFIVIEDIDSIGVTHNRDDIKDTSELKDEQIKGTLTLAGILNAIDGIASPEGRILFITTNHADVLDPALIRPGRIDMHETIEPLDADLALAMCRRFHPDRAAEIFETYVREHLPMPAANLQNILLQLD